MVKLRHRHSAEHEDGVVRAPAAEDAVDLRDRPDDRAMENRRVEEWARQNDRERPIATEQTPVADQRTVVDPPTAAERPIVAYPPTANDRRAVAERPVAVPVESTPEPAAIRETVVTWGAGQFVALVVGVGMLILGTVALARSGLDLNRLYSPHVEVAGLHHTPLLGVLEVAFGLLTIAAAAVPGTVRSLVVLLGITALAAGIIVLVATGTWLHDHLGVHRANGWLFIVDGALLILAAMMPATRVREVKVSRRMRRRR